MTKSAKVAVSLPAETLRRLDQESKRLELSRSATVARAIEAWVAARDMEEADQRYVEGYLRQPEGSVAEVAAAVTAGWEPWE